MENSQGEEKNSMNSNPPDYAQEVKNFRRESMLSSEIQEEHKKKALMKCKDLHDKLMDCYESKYFCGTAEKEFWDCYRNERVLLFFGII